MVALRNKALKLDAPVVILQWIEKPGEIAEIPALSNGNIMGKSYEWMDMDGHGEIPGGYTARNSWGLKILKALKYLEDQVLACTPRNGDQVLRTRVRPVAFQLLSMKQWPTFRRKSCVGGFPARKTLQATALGDDHLHDRCAREDSEGATAGASMQWISPSKNGDTKW